MFENRGLKWPFKNSVKSDGKTIGLQKLCLSFTECARKQQVSFTDPQMFILFRKVVKRSGEV